MKKLLKLKRLLRARNKSGFTLVEVIISCSLLAILVLGIMSFVTPVLKMLSSGQKNARATMLAETLDTYISGVLRTASVVEVFENVPIAAPSTSNLSMASYGSGITNINTFMATDDNSDKYEVRALGIITKNEGDLNRQGVRVYNMDVDQSTFAAKMPTASLAFHDLMFEGLYPIVQVSTFLSEEDDVDESAGIPNAKGYKVETLVYTDSKCYNIDSDERDKSLLVFQGVTFFENLNFKTGASDVIKVAADAQTAMDAYAEHSSGGLFYPATIIYYVAPKK